MTAPDEPTVLTEGKTKIIYDDHDGTVLVVSKDDITAGDGARHDLMVGKAVHATTTTVNLFEYLESVTTVPSHYVDEVDDHTFRARKVRMIPVEVVMRRIAFGSFLKRWPDAEEFSRFDEVRVEFFEKDDPNHDPLLIINEDDGTVDRHAASVPFGEGPLGAYPDEDAAVLVEIADELKEYGIAIFEALEKAWAELGHTLVDLKVEFGFDAETGTLVLADVIDNDSWRVWLDGDPEKQVDKQVYRDHGLKEPETAKRIKGNYALVAELTVQFRFM